MSRTRAACLIAHVYSHWYQHRKMHVVVLHPILIFSGGRRLCGTCFVALCCLVRMWLLACALALTPSAVHSFSSLVPLIMTSFWCERVRSSSWGVLAVLCSFGATLVQHIVSTDTKPCKRPTVVFYFLGLWCSLPYRAAAQRLCVS